MRKVLLTLMVLGAVGSTVGAGTFASFSATASNGNGVIQTGSILLSNTKTGADGVYATYNTCFSNTSGSTVSSANSNGSCDQLINVEVKKPGDVAYADLTLQNVGSLGGVLKVKASQVCSTTNAAGQSYSGGGNACTGNRMYIQRFSSIANRNAGITTGGQCFYGGGTATACAFNSTYSIDHFSTTYPSNDSSPALTLGSMPAGGLYLLRVAVELPSGAANNLQGRQANFGFTWTLEQA